MVTIKVKDETHTFTHIGSKKSIKEKFKGSPEEPLKIISTKKQKL